MRGKKSARGGRKRAGVRGWWSVTETRTESGTASETGTGKEAKAASETASERTGKRDKGSVRSARELLNWHSLNNGNATAEEIEKLIKKVKSDVFIKTGINLELEIQVIGNNK